MEETRQLRTQLDLMQAALDHINQGFSVFDADLRLVAWNRGLWEMLDFPQKLARRGTHLEAFLRVNAERGEYGPGDIEGKIQRRLARAKLFEPHYFERIRPNGQVIAVSGTPCRRAVSSPPIPMSPKTGAGRRNWNARSRNAPGRCNSPRTGCGS